MPLFVASQATIDIMPKVVSAVVYQNGALVTCRGNASIEEGKTTVVFHGLPSKIDKQSIQLASDAEITILSVTSHQDYLAENKKSTRVKKWQDSLEVLNDELESTQNNISIFEDAKKLLDNNRTVGGTNTGTTVLAVKSMYEYYVKQVNTIDDSLMRLHKRESRLTSRIKKISDEISEWRTKTDTIVGDVEASISCAKSQDINFQLSYFTYDAVWSPIYDLRAQDTRHNCQFSYKANISQHTGQDWNNIDLTLSSSNPTLNQTAPTLNPWYLQYYSPVYNARAELDASSSVAGVYNSDALEFKAPAAKAMTRPMAVANTTKESNLAVEFNIDVPYSLPSDNKPHTLEIKQYDLPAYFHYICIPKLQKDVFLLAGITKWEDLNILPGQVNIYYSGAYIGKSYISPENTSDTLDLSFGMDKKVVVKRIKTKNFSAAQWIGGYKTQTFGWEINLHNSQNDSISIDVSDQIPLSTDKEIEITPMDLGGAKKDDANGKLTWHITLSAQETKKLTFSYSVKYPKDKTIQNLWQ